MTRPRYRTFGVALACVIGALPLSGQSWCDTLPRPILVGSEWEQYLRAVQLLGKIPSDPWTVRGFSPTQWARLSTSDSTLPWAAAARQPALCLGRLRVRLLPREAGVVYNSSFPYGANDGAMWTGRGLTAVASGGVVGSYGPVTLTLAPQAFIAQNVPFSLMPTGLAGPEAFAHWQSPRFIDLPQRFGDRSYGVIDPGASTLEINLWPVAIGVSTQNQFWGPATDQPILFGSNAPGFPHAFVRSARPIKAPYLGRFHGGISVGALDESPYTTMADSTSARVVTGLVASFQPAVFPQLEIGGGRVFQMLRPRLHFTWADVTRPFGRLLNSAEPELAADQLVAIFARLVLPSAGMELYGEFGREDASADIRDFISMPDHDASYLLGLRKVWSDPGGMLSLRAEILNSRITHLALSSTQTSWYIHSSVRQGFTHRGQVIGAPGAYGGGASIVAFERFHRAGRWRVTWERTQLAESRDRRQGNAPDLFKNDVAHALGFNVRRARTRIDLELGSALVYEINRYTKRSDAVNLQTTLRVSSPLLSRSR